MVLETQKSGGNTVAELDYYQGAAGTYAGFDRFGRVQDQKWTDGTDPIDRYGYGYDANSNRLYRENPLDGAPLARPPELRILSPKPQNYLSCPDCAARVRFRVRAGTPGKCRLPMISEGAEFAARMVIMDLFNKGGTPMPPCQDDAVNHGEFSAACFRRRPMAVVPSLALGLWCVLGLGTSDADANGPNLLPTPKSVSMAEGTMPLTAGSRIVATDPRLEPLAAILSDEISILTGLKIATAKDAGRAGDIVLKINPRLRADADILAVQNQKIVHTRDFAHTIAISDTAVVEGWDYRAVCEGTATILQAITGKDGKYALPRTKIKDWPHADYTGVMVDVARQRIPIDALKAVIKACRLWKIRYCQLHLSDDEGFTFPSKAFPKLGSKNVAMTIFGGVPPAVPEVYDPKALRDLVAFADARGVTLVPELETPGHSEAMCRAMPEVFAGPKVMKITSDDMYKALDTLVGEMCDVFKSSPYFHIGGDESYLNEIEELAETKAYIKKKGMKGFGDVAVQHVRRMNEIVRRKGKMTLAWDGDKMAFDPKTMKDEVIIMNWFPWPLADGLQKQGFATITVPWDPGAPPDWNIYVCNQCRLAPKARVLGASQTMWMMSASALVGDFLGGDVNGASCEGYIRSLCDRAERTWGPANKIEDAEFKNRTAAARALLDKLVLPVKVEDQGAAYRSWTVLGRVYFGGTVQVRMSSVLPGGEIRYTTDGSEPSPKSPVYAAPINLVEATAINAALFRNGRQAGHVTRAFYEPLDTGGVIEKWMVSGPYTMAGKDATALFDVAFEPEKGGKAEWKPYSGGRVVLGDVPGFGGNHRVAYMRAEVWSPKAQKARLYVTSDDGVKVFLNGKVVHGANVARQPFVADQVDISLQEGWNQLLVKVTNFDTGWEASVRVRNASGGKLDEMRIKAE